MKYGIILFIVALFSCSGCVHSAKDHQHIVQHEAKLPGAKPETKQGRAAEPGPAKTPADRTEVREQREPAETEELSVGFVPTLLEIPTIRVKAAVEPVGVLPNGQMGVPKAFDKVGLLMPWTKPGELGNAVIAGHFDHYTGPAVFYHLRKLRPGDKIVVSDRKGSALTFRVSKVESYPTKEAPIEAIFGESDKAHLNLITCAGKFNRKTGEHARRLVVFTELEPRNSTGK
jgi:LPXTG-site transpeptidase (sortase) family protein